MPGTLFSAVLLIVCTVFSGSIGYLWLKNISLGITFAAGGLILGFILLRLFRLWLKLDIFRIIGAVIGLLAGALASTLLTSGYQISVVSQDLSSLVHAFLTIVLCLIGFQLGSAKAKELKKKVESVSEVTRKTIGILDTSVIIDGRIADVCETGFVSGDLLIPQFVLKELQMIADSSESTKRTRGRRGLDILNKMQKLIYVGIIIDDTDYPSVKEVDQKLISMAKETGHAILTNDFNLNKVAEVHSIQVLNINQLANSLKPVVLPGETMKVQVIKEGKEHGQGVAYLDDGTMVVVDNGRRYMGRNVDVTVTSVLQTTAGRMIFAVMKV
jgi:uncharacterized protein YacL